MKSKTDGDRLERVFMRVRGNPEALALIVHLAEALAAKDIPRRKLEYYSKST